MINILYFASLRDALGVSGEEIELDDTISDVQSLRNKICQRGEPWQGLFGAEKRLMFAVNQTMSQADAVIVDGDEVAFFPPVTGG